MLVYLKLLHFPETNMFAPENGWLEDEVSFWDFAYFRGELLVSGRVLLGNCCLSFVMFPGVYLSENEPMSPKKKPFEKEISYSINHFSGSNVIFQKSIPIRHPKKSTTSGGGGSVDFVC